MTEVDDIEERYRVWAKTRGYRSLNHRRVCPMLVAGRRCRDRLRESCICLRWRSVLDHARMWRVPGAGSNGGTGCALTAEPYGVPETDLAGFREELGELGLRAEVSEDSPWNPGKTVLILVTRD
jgi:hypothetical protein